MAKPIVKCVILIFLISACSPAKPIVVPNAFTDTPTRQVPTNTQLPTSTYTPEPTLTQTPISQDERDILSQAYKIMLFIYLDLNMLSETANKINSGELSGFDAFGALFSQIALINAVDEAIPVTTVPNAITKDWEDATSIHEVTKEIVSKWWNKEIDSGEVMVQVSSYLDVIDKTMKSVEKDLARMFGGSARDLEKIREDAIQEFYGIFSTPTPTP